MSFNMKGVKVNKFNLFVNSTVGKMLFPVVSSKSNSSLIDSSASRLMLFDLSVGGHHPNYIRYLIEHWNHKKIEGHLFIVVSPDFFKKHDDVVRLSTPSIEFIAISSDEATRLIQSKQAVQSSFLEWELHCKYAATLQIDHSLLMYFDHLQLPIIFGTRPPCMFSGIYFRPTFHYKHFENYVPTIKDIFRAWRQKLLLSVVLKNKQLATIFSLDCYAVPYIESLAPKSKGIKHLPDPITAIQVTPQDVQDFKKNLGIEENRKVFLLFGLLSERKGIFQVLEAAKLLTTDVAQRCCLLLIGEIPTIIKSDILDIIDDLRRKSSIQIIINDDYQSEEIIPLYFSASDIILAPYQQHVGMSGILLWAAAAKRFILASNYGLLGELVYRYKLGIQVDSTNPEEIVKSIIQLINCEHIILGDYSKMSELISQNSSSQFAEIVFKSILDKKD
jgi:glycosyltransferase involved in cell wall biosynthesis